MNERDFTINGVEFKLNKIDVFKQFHIARKIAPIMADIMPAVMDIAKITADGKGEMDMDKVAALLKPAMEGFSKLSESDSDKVFLGLLECVEMKQSAGNYAFIARGGNLMFQTLELPVMLQCAGRAFMFNMAGFFSSMPQTLQEVKSKLKAK